MLVKERLSEETDSAISTIKRVQKSMRRMLIRGSVKYQNARGGGERGGEGSLFISLTARLAGREVARVFLTMTMELTW